MFYIVVEATMTAVLLIKLAEGARVGALSAAPGA